MATAELIVFDLDGTLIDSLADIGGAMNALLRELDLPARPLADYKWIVGDGARVAVMRACGGRFDNDTARLDALTQRYLDIYQARGSFESAPYAGVESLLARLSGRAALAVLTNKPHNIAEDLVRRAFGPNVFMAVEGVRPGTARKPDPAGLLSIVRRAGAATESTVYVGDTDTDVRTGQAAGIFTIGCAWGFRGRAELTRAGADAIIDSPSELPAAAGLTER